MINKKAQGLPINVIVMMIIGLVLFGIGMALFTDIAGSGEDTIEDLNQRIKSDISSLECAGDDWICVPSIKMKNSDSQTYEVFVANRAQINKKYYIDIVTEDLDGNRAITNSNGAVIITYPNIETNILSGNSASFPFVVKTSRVAKVPSSFVTTAILYDENSEEIDRTPIIIKVE